ncbi:AAA family ATPase [Comamonas odontotermitis]|uniref:AAA family ATPase n=1 Tax=Comamonas odontotermitis TaxID=379895 RepID=UPI001CC37B97|nr:AAA family ATPase [Comamonas odontotermitis]UBB18293.1 AAA family ATPase [Comamonas odontotermitis]
MTDSVFKPSDGFVLLGTRMVEQWKASANDENKNMNDLRTPSELLLREQMHERQQNLQAIAAQLKTELIGIDDVIDRVIGAVRAWYVMPQLITRPVIVCLWGLTGTGKTQLTRRLAQLLGFYDRFVEVQMDGFSQNSGNYGASTISGTLESAGLVEGVPGILVLDEFQRYRTVSSRGEDSKVERYQDVWALLSDGKLPPALSELHNMERKLADAHYEAEREDEDDEEERRKKQKLRYKIDAWDAQALKRSLKLAEPLIEIMQWSNDYIHQLLVKFRESQQSWETDYSKLLVFVCGNLDEMYTETASRVEDCDTDADIFHRLTSRLSLIDVKRALAERFKPEQIARLGNHHVIYPSFSRATYEQLIAATVRNYVQGIADNCGLHFVIGSDVLAQIYQNAVFPTQGTRPLFSSVHTILSSSLVDAALWALEQGAQAGQSLQVHMAPDTAELVVQMQLPLHEAVGGQVHSQRFAVPLDLNRIKQRTSADFRALLAVHEAGHGLVYALLFGRAPQELKINIATFEGGYNSFTELQATSRRNMLDMVCVGLAGRAAERHVFGEAACTTGAEQDIRQATAEAARYLRHLGFGDRLSRTDVADESGENMNTEVEPTNTAIEALLQAQMLRAQQLLVQHDALLVAMTEVLMREGLITPAAMVALCAAQGQPVALTVAKGGDAPEPKLVLEPYASMLAAHTQGAA